MITFANDKLIKMGASIKLVEPTTIEVSCKNRLNSINFVTQPYPRFPTDLQAIAMTLLTTSNGVGIITESLYENRFMQVPDLRRMGADIHQDRNHAIVKGVKNLTGATVAASDLRAGAALVIAGLMASGETIVEKLQTPIVNNGSFLILSTYNIFNYQHSVKLLKTFLRPLYC